jgi:hypothetical protein
MYKAEMFVKKSLFGKFVIISISLVLSLLGMYLNYGDTWITYVGGMLIGWIIGNILVPIYTAHLQKVIYNGDKQAFIDDMNKYDPDVKTLDDHKQMMQVGLDIIESGPLVAKFMGAEIFDWVKLRGEDNKIYKFNYYAAIDMNKAVPPLPENAFIIEPGIIYDMDVSFIE